MPQAFGVIGLAVMGENIARNIERNGFPIAVYNRTWEKTEHFLNGPAKGAKALGARTLKEFVGALEKPRRVLLMVQAGKAVDAVLEELKTLLEPGDIVIDGGNSHFPDTDRRGAALAPTGIRFFGMGVSGGEEGALWGPSLMPGGDEAAYRALEPVLTKIAAKSDSGPCVTYVGAKSAGHFVKMTHNGIEYGDMQLIAESYDLLKNIGGLSNAELAAAFGEWNRGDLQSFLIEITAKIVNFPDDQGTGKTLIDLILDKAGQKGTGKWTTAAALDLGISIPTITAAVDARILSSMKAVRVQAAKVYPAPKPPANVDRKALVGQVRSALYASKICSYAQGFDLMRAAGKEYGYGLKFGEIARIWKGGCIIRAVFLDRIRQAFEKNPELPNLLLDDGFRKEIEARVDDWRRVVTLAAQAGMTPPAMAASLAYFDSFRRERLPANLIQGQRDFFGAHTYERTDKPGAFHTHWS